MLRKALSDEIMKVIIKLKILHTDIKYDHIEIKDSGKTYSPEDG